MKLYLLTLRQPNNTVKVLKRRQSFNIIDDLWSWRRNTQCPFYRVPEHSRCHRKMQALYAI